MLSKVTDIRKSDRNVFSGEKYNISWISNFLVQILSTCSLAELDSKSYSRGTDYLTFIIGYKDHGKNSQEGR